MLLKNLYKKNLLITSLLLLFFWGVSAQSDDVFGRWKTVDDVTGEVKSVVEIYEKDGKAYGKVSKILHPDPSKQFTTCDRCTDERKDQRVLGMIIINGLKKDGKQYNGGKILDPERGKEYKCYISLVEKNKLKVRGYIGIKLLGRTQYWFREEQ